uniref:Uncharacterized protein n=1 Tax=Rhabditophanes sp. KR3021 TaxID=114890 RepID=A0AC35TU89_9BILA
MVTYGKKAYVKIDDEKTGGGENNKAQITIGKGKQRIHINVLLPPNNFSESCGDENSKHLLKTNKQINALFPTHDPIARQPIVNPNFGDEQ